MFTISINLPVSSSKATKSATAPLVVAFPKLVIVFAPLTNCKGFTGAVRYQPDKNWEILLVTAPEAVSGSSTSGNTFSNALPPIFVGSPDTGNLILLFMTSS